MTDAGGHPREGSGGAGELERLASLGRAVVGAPVFFGATFAGSAASLALAQLGQTRAIDEVIRTWARATLRLFGVEVEARGLAHLPSGGALYLFNHQSHMDIPAIYSVVERTLRAGAKIELFDIPVFGPAMRAVGVLPITRDRPQAVFDLYKEAARHFAEGTSYLLAPEGTRQDGPRIGPFKKGPFRFAVDAQVPLVPLVIKGTWQVLPKGRFFINTGRWRRTVRVEVLPPVDTRGLGVGDVASLRDRIHAAMVAAFEAA